MAATPVNKAGAYHTSICVDGVELYFSKAGICLDSEWASHKMGGALRLNGPVEVRQIGVTTLSVEELLQAIQPHFQPGTYDLLRKNCNSFTDCALSYLLGQRLDKGFNSIDRMASFAESRFGVIGILIGYTPNPRAALFMIDNTIKHLKTLSDQAARYRSNYIGGGVGVGPV